MTLQRIENGPMFPHTFMGNTRLNWTGTTGGIAFTGSPMIIDAANEKMAWIGEVMWDGAPASKTMSSAGAKVHFRTHNVTFADAGTTVRIGLQGIQGEGSGATRATPDGTFSVYADVVGNGGVITSSDDLVAKAISMATGSKSVAHGELVAVVFDMTSRGGADSLSMSGLGGIGYCVRPGGASNTAGTWVYLATTSAIANVLLEADDGTFGILRGGLFVLNSGVRSFNASSSPDEYGLIFQVPFRCKIDSATFSYGSNISANADGEIRLYSTPLGTPTLLHTYTMPGEQGSGYTDDRPTTVQFASEYELAPNTDYCVALRATGTSSVDLGYAILSSADHRHVMGLRNCRMGHRTDITGAFVETTTEIPMMAVGISAIDDGTGSGRSTLAIGV